MLTIKKEKIHGQDDEVVPKKMMETTEIILKDNNIDADTHLIENLMRLILLLYRQFFSSHLQFKNI